MKRGRFQSRDPVSEPMQEQAKVLDLTSPLSDQLMRALAALEDTEMGETLLLLFNQDPHPLLNQLCPILKGDFEWRILVDGQESWTVMIQRKGMSQDAK